MAPPRICAGLWHQPIQTTAIYRPVQMLPPSLFLSHLLVIFTAATYSSFHLPLLSFLLCMAAARVRPRPTPTQPRRRGPGAASAPPPRACYARSAPLCLLPLRICRAGSSNLHVCIWLKSIRSILQFYASPISVICIIAFRRIVEIDFSSLRVSCQIPFVAPLCYEFGRRWRNSGEGEHVTLETYKKKNKDFLELCKKDR
jgi:hypothetical protein